MTGTSLATQVLGWIPFGVIQDVQSTVEKRWQNISQSCQLTAQHIFKHVTSFALSQALLFVNKKGQHKKVVAYRHKLDTLTSSAHAKEAARAISRLIFDYLKAYIVAAPTMQKVYVPSWAGELLDQDPTQGYTLNGQIAFFSVSEHEELFVEFLELNFLKMFISLYEHLFSLQKKNPYQLLDFIKASADKLTLYFDGLQKPNHLRKMPVFDVQNLAADFLKILLPENENGLEVAFLDDPVFEPLTKVIKEKLFAKLAQAAIPAAFSLALKELSDPLVRDLLLIEGFSALRQFINEEVQDEEAPACATLYPKQEELNRAVGALVAAFLAYIDDASKKRLLHHVGQDELGNMLGAAIVTQVGSKTFSELLKDAIVLFLPIINPHGVWTGEANKDASVRFCIARNIFAITHNEFVTQEQARAEFQNKTQAILKALVENVGKKSSGIHQMAQKKFLSTALECTSSARSGIFAAIDFVQNKVQELQHQAKKGLVFLSCRYIARKVRFLSHDIFVKMQKPEHLQVCSQLACDMVHFIRRT